MPDSLPPRVASLYIDLYPQPWQPSALQAQTIKKEFTRLDAREAQLKVSIDIPDKEQGEPKATALVWLILIGLAVAGFFLLTLMV